MIEIMKTVVISLYLPEKIDGGSYENDKYATNPNHSKHPNT